MAIRIMRNASPVFCCFVIFLSVGLLAVAQEARVPRFEDYPAAVWRGTVVPLNLRSHPLARMYKTSTRQQMRAEGVNFAGHYALVAMGCGTGCSITGIVDARTGQAYFPKEFEGWTGIVGDYEIPEGEDIRTFHSNSRLLKAIGRPNIGRPGEERYGPSGIYYYEWKNNRLRQVKFTQVGSYPKADPPRGNR